MSPRLEAVARAIARRPGRTLAAALLASALALAGVSRLGLDADLVALLPEGSPAAADYRLFLERFGGFEKVFVVVLAPPAPELAASPSARAQRGARRLEELLVAADAERRRSGGRQLIASARSGIGPDDEQFVLRHGLPRALLLLPESEWRAALAERTEPAAIAARTRRLRRSLTTPAGGFEAPLARADPLGFAELLPAFASGPSGLPIDPLTSTFLAPAGDASLLVLEPASAELDAAGGRELLAALDAAFAALRAETEGPLELHAVGGPLYAAQDEALLRGDLERTLSGSLLGCAAILVIAFEGVLLPLVCLAALAFGLLWTAGLAGVTLGAVTGVSVGFASIVVGLGVDYAIHGATSYRQQRLAGADRERALAGAWVHSGPGIATSALTTAGAFAVLTQAHFRPLSELGTVVGVGMLAVLAATATAGGALLVLLPPPRRRPGRAWRLLGSLVEAAAGLAERRPRAVLGAAALLSLVALAGIGSLRLDPGLEALRPADHPALAGERLLVDRFALGLDTATIVVPGADRGEALERAARVAETLRAAAPAGVSVTSPADWLPGEARVERRLAELGGTAEGARLEAAADRLENELAAAGLAPRAFATGLEALRALAAGEDPAPPPADSLPRWLGELLRDDEDGGWAAISLRLPEGTWSDGPPAELLGELRAAAPGLAFASAVAMAPELREVAARDLEALAGWALALVALAVLISFRGRPKPALLALLPVSVAVLWTLGLWALAGRSLDLVSLAVVPVMLGIGIDDGLHAVHGSGAAGLGASVREAGRAMTLTTLTTVVGFGSLVLSRVPGLANGGLLVALGVLASLAATLLLLPALGAIGARRRLAMRGARP